MKMEWINAQKTEFNKFHFVSVNETLTVHNMFIKKVFSEGHSIRTRTSPNRPIAGTTRQWPMDMCSEWYCIWSYLMWTSGVTCRVNFHVNIWIELNNDYKTNSHFLNVNYFTMKRIFFKKISWSNPYRPPCSCKNRMARPK